MLFLLCLVYSSPYVEVHEPFHACDVRPYPFPGREPAIVEILDLAKEIRTEKGYLKGADGMKALRYQYTLQIGGRLEIC
jgi:hypothetical protein